MNKWIIKNLWCVRHCASHLWSLCSSCPGCGERVIYFLIILCSLFTCTSWVLNPGLLVVNCKELLSESSQQPGFLGNVSNQLLHLFLGLNSLDWLPLEWLDCSSFHLVILALPEMWWHFLHIYTGFFFKCRREFITDMIMLHSQTWIHSHTWKWKWSCSVVSDSLWPHGP